MRYELKYYPFITILVPTLNEEENLAKTLKELQKVEEKLKGVGSVPTIIVTDSGSKDSTLEIAYSNGADIIESKLGKGANIKYTLESIRSSKNKPDYLVMLDADNTYPAYLIPTYIEIMENNKDIDLIRLRRTPQPSAMSWTHWIWNKSISLFASILYQQYTHDLCSGMIIFNKKALNEISITAKGFELEANIFIEQKRHKWKTREVKGPLYKREGLRRGISWTQAFPIIWFLLKERFKK